MPWLQIILINAASLALTFAGAYLGAALGVKRSLRRPAASEPTVEIGGVTMPQSHYFAATDPLRYPDGSPRSSAHRG